MMFRFPSPITKDNVPELLKKIETAQKHRKCNTRILNAAALVFALCFTMLLATLIVQVFHVELLVVAQLPWLNTAIRFIHTEMILPLAPSWPMLLVLGIALTVVPPFVVALLIKLVCLAFVNVSKTPKGDIFTLQNEAKSFLGKDDADFKSLGKRWATIMVGCDFALTLWELYLAAESVNNFGRRVLNEAVACVIAYFLLRLVLAVVFSIVPHFRFNKKKVAAFVSAVDDACEREKEERARIKKEKEKKKEEQLAKERAEEAARKAKEKAEHLQRGAELYQQASAGEEIDEDLMQEAADLGDPNACLYIGKKMVSDISGYTTREIKGIYSQAKLYFKKASDSKLTDGVFLYCSAAMMTESLNYDRAYDLLKMLRSIKKNELSDGLEDVYSTSLETLVDLVNDLEEKQNRHTEQEQRRRAEANREPVVRRCYCKFFNAGICNYYSTSSYIAHCKYVSNPGQCSAALLNKGLGFESE